MRRNKFVKIIVIIISAVLLSVSAYALWQYVIPRYVACGVISKFEDACYSSDEGRIMELTYPDSGYYKSSRYGGLRELTGEFKRYNKGFKILKTGHYFKFLEYDKSKSRKEIIGLYLSKQMNDGKTVCYQSVDLVKTDGRWKVLNYHFNLPPKCILSNEYDLPNIFGI
jgi:hypothetical protein